MTNAEKELPKIDISAEDLQTPTVDWHQKYREFEQKEFELWFDVAVKPDEQAEAIQRLAKEKWPDFAPKEPCSQLYPIETKPNVRKALILEAARSVKKNFPNYTVKQAAQYLICWHKETRPEERAYSEKHLMRMIKCLGFASGKSGRPVKK